MTELEVTQAKAKLLADYRDPTSGINDAVILQQFSQGLRHVPDKAKYGWNEDLIESKSRIEQHGFEHIQTKANRGDRPFGGGPMTKDVLDSGINTGTMQGGGVLARVDIVPQVYVWMVTEFPALDRISRIPSNGLNHTWNNLVDFGDAADQFIDEFGCPLPSKGIYFQGSTNIAILAVERGASLKLDWATRQSGMLYNGNMSVTDLELRNAVWSRAKIFQKCFYQGTSASGHTGADEYGQTFANGFNGLRVLLSNHANGVHSNFYPTAGATTYGPVIVDKGTSTYTDAIDAAAAQIMDNGGRPTAVHMTTTAARRLRAEGTNLLRYATDDVGGGFVLGGHVRAIDTVAGELDVVIVPGPSIGSYTADATSGTYNGQIVQDMYVLDERNMAIPYLGTPDPMPIEIPIGVPSANGGACLTRRVIIYWMAGLAIFVPIFCAKVRYLL